jgi:hypothetical protein
MTVVSDERFTDQAGELVRLESSILHALDTLASSGRMTVTSLDLQPDDGGDLPYEAYETFGGWLGQVNRSCSWWLGDWLLYGEGTYGERYAQAISVTGLTEETLLRRVAICRGIPPSRRKATVPFSAHGLVHRLPAREQKRWLERAERAGWGYRELRAAMAAIRREERPTLLAEDAPLSADAVLEAARALVASRREMGDGWLVSREAMARLAAAVGLED